MLLIDIGNSRIKSGVWRDNACALLPPTPHLAADLNALFAGLFKNVSPQPVYVACVVNEMVVPLSKWFIKNWNLQPAFVNAEHSMAGVTNAYLKQDALGVDRWLGLIAAYNQHNAAVCVVDCGTAVTLDVVNQAGIHQGGLIMPGLRLMQETLFKSTSKINNEHGELVALAKNTHDGVESGCMQLLSAGLQQIIKKQQSAFDDLRVVITGGDGELVSQYMQVSCTYVETLVLDGLRIVAAKVC